MRGFLRCLPAVALAFAGHCFAHDLVSAGPDQLPLAPSPITTFDGPAYSPLDVSADGRFVLFANFDPDVFFGFATALTEECKIYRKDRATGDLLVVFDSAGLDRDYCNRAKMSADGNVIVTSPSYVAPDPSAEPPGDIFFGNPTQIVVAVYDATTNTSTEIVADLESQQSANDIGRIRLGAGIMPIPAGLNIEYLNAAGNVALSSVVEVVGDVVAAVPLLIDIEAGTVERAAAPDVDYGDAEPFLNGLSVSGGGRFLAMSVSLSTTVPNPEPPPPGWFGPWETVETENAIFRVDRSTGSVIKALLPDEPDPIQGLIRFGRTLTPGALSNNGNVVTWVEPPPLCTPEGTPFPFGGLLEPCAPDLPLRACEAEECEPTVRRYFFNSLVLNSQQPTPRSTSKQLNTQEIQFSADAVWMLFSRQIRNPFGGDYEIPVQSPVPPDGFICINRASADSGSSVPVEEVCEETNPGPIPPPGAPILGTDYTKLAAPKIWVLRNLQTGAEFSVSTDDNGFQAGRAIMSDDAATVVYESRDPRLRDDDLSGINFLDESLLDDACFWPD
ncbi:MAG: hypothetical protein KJP03_00710, partial [Gammaproteobacteria bacterium]|nr:hypothetical protein [Gammaproteobacteria bacterium]